jgi:hypothetical protein
MGMDVYGIKATDKEGEYFRNNCWYWRPLWQFCEQVAPNLCAKVKYGQSNDGDGLKNQKDCTALSDALLLAVANQTPYTPRGGLSLRDYFFDYENVLEFARFLRTCGGFEIL